MDGSILIDSRPKITVRKAKIICAADNFYCAGIVNFTMLAFMSQAFGNIRASPRTCKREPQTVTEKLSHQIAKRWREPETFARRRSYTWSI